jgi:hypothetical protein
MNLVRSIGPLSAVCPQQSAISPFLHPSTRRDIPVANRPPMADNVLSLVRDSPKLIPAVLRNKQ